MVDNTSPEMRVADVADANTGGSELRIFYTNIRSLNNDHFNELCLYLKEEEGIDVIALSETWIGTEQRKYFKISGYRSFIQPRGAGRRSVGIVLYVKEHLIVRNITKTNLVTANLMEIELLTYNVTNNKTTTITYFDTGVSRDSTSSRRKFTYELQQILTTTKGNAILLGDININILNSFEAAEYLDMIQMEGFSIDHEKPTRGLSCLDQVMLTSDCVQTEVELHKLRITDHAMIKIQVSLPPEMGKFMILKFKFIPVQFMTLKVQFSFIKFKFAKTMFKFRT